MLDLEWGKDYDPGNEKFFVSNLPLDEKKKQRNPIQPEEEIILSGQL